MTPSDDGNNILDGHASIDDCRLQLAYARNLFNGLHDQIVKLAEENPYVLTREIDFKTGDQSFKCLNPPLFPRKWTLPINGIVSNLRTSLDYLVSALVTEFGGQVNGNHTFPISDSKDAYFRKNRRGVTYRDRVLAGIPEHIRVKIDELQPYQRGDLAYADTLGALAYMDNRQKHRHPHPAYSYVNLPGGRAILIPSDNEFSNLEIRLLAEGGIDIKAKFASGGRRSMQGIVYYPKVQVQRSPGVEVVFGYDPGKVVGMDDIHMMIEYVNWIIEGFAPEIESARAEAA